MLLTSRPLASDGTSEYVGSLLLTIAGLMLVAGAGDLVLLFVGLELISIPTYMLLYLGRRDAAVPGVDRQVLLPERARLGDSAVRVQFPLRRGRLDRVWPPSGRRSATRRRCRRASRPSSKLALALIFAGLCFKIAAVPFHFYAPDVYQGTTHPNAALLSVVPKAAGLVALVRILVVAMPGMEPYAWQIVLVVSVLTMTFGNVLALWQDNLRRLLAYSSIAHAGYMLIGLAVALATGNAPGAWNGVAALAFYLAAYAAATIGAFAVLEHLGRPDRRLDGVDELAGLGRTRPAGGRRAGRVHVQPDGHAAAGRLLGQAAGVRQRA